jgi:hypothetical protein
LKDRVNADLLAFISGTGTAGTATRQTEKAGIR